jgi:hypothetical protein
MGKLASEGHNDQHPKNTPTQVDHSIDRLARGLATGTVSRRKALRMLGAALVGGALASIPGVAWAAKGGNSECVKCCKENFPPGPERGQCISAGARGECPVTCDGNGGGECPPGSLPPVSGGSLVTHQRIREFAGTAAFSTRVRVRSCACVAPLVAHVPALPNPTLTPA